MGKPLLLIDVDGPLNPYARSNTQLRKTTSSRSDTPPEGRFHSHKLLGFTVWLNRWHGEQLLALANVFDLVWATTWEHDANRLIGPRIGLPDLPVIEFGDSPARKDSRLHWKVASIRVFVAGRPFAWVDDEISRWDEQYFLDVHEAPVLLRSIEPAVGLTEADFAALREWAEGGMHDGEG